MLVLSTLHDLLSQLVEPHSVHTAMLLTPSGQLVSYAGDQTKTKDEVRVLVAVAAEVWQQTKARDAGMVESEVPRRALPAAAVRTVR